MPATKNGSTHSRKNRLTPICAAIAGAVMSFANVAEADDSVSFSSNYWIGTFITGDDSANTSSDWMYPLNWQFGNLYAAPLPGWNTYIGPSKVIVNGIPSGYQFHATEAVLAAPFSASIFGMGAWDGQSQLRLRDGALLDATAYIGTTALLDDPLYNLAGPYIATGPIKPATIIFDGGSTAGSWNFYANSRVEVNKAYAQAQGTWSGTLGELVVAKNASFVIGNNGLTINKISNSGNIDLGGSNLSVSGTLDSSGTINLGGAALILTGNTTLAGQGQTVLNGGYIDSAYGTNQTLTIASGHTLRGYGNLGGGYYGSNTQVINQGSIVADQTSPLYFSGASLDNTNGLIEIKDGSQFNVGYGTVNGGVIKGQGNGTLAGSGSFANLVLRGGLNITGNAFSDVTFEDNNQLNSGGVVYLSKTITNTGTLNVNGSALILTGNTTLAGQGQTVLNGGYIDSAYGTSQTLTIASGHTLRGYGNLGGGYYGSNTQVINQGSIVADQTSPLYFSGASLDNTNGLIEIKDGSQFNVGSGTVNGGVIKGQGSATLSGGTYKDLGLSGQLQVQSGLVYISGSIANQGTLNVNGSVLILTGNTTLAGSGQTVLNGGYIDSAYGTNQTLTIASGHTLRGYGNLGGGYYGSNTQVNNQGRIVADTGSTLYVSGSALNNQGGIVVTKDSVMNIAGGTSFVQDGAQAKTVVHGTLSVNELTLAAGQLSGNGKIIGNVVNTGGQVNPGASPGKLSIEGNYTQGADGDLVIEINGTEQGVTYDWLSVAGDVSLAGDLYLQIGAGLTDGLSFDILSYTGQLTGAFDHIYANGWNVQTTYGAQGLSVTLTTAVPEPESYALALAGLLLAFTAARRRQKAA
jgi:hypothetical protein